MKFEILKIRTVMLELVKIFFFYHITTGKFLRKSIIFQAQIHHKYHEYHIRNRDGHPAGKFEPGVFDPAHLSSALTRF